jgi:hypothetical protein
VRNEGPQRRHLRGGLAGLAALALTLLALGPGAPIAEAASKPEIPAAWSTEVVATSARLRAEVNPEGSRTTYHFNYITAQRYAEDGEAFGAGTAKAPAGTDPSIGEGVVTLAVFQSISNLAAETAYRYRVQATNAAGTETSATYAFRTQGLGGGALLADSRGWEMVSPVDKNGGQVEGPGETDGGGVLQAAAQGSAATYSSPASFGEGAQGAPQASQYISRRTESGWTTQNITAPMLSGSYGEAPNGVPYQLFSPDLARGLLLNGEHCREQEPSRCPIANPPLPGSGAPAGYQDYYLRNDESGGFSALMTQANSPSLTLSSSRFDLALAGSAPELTHVVFSTCAKLTADASEVAGSEGCDPSEQNLYEWSGGGLALVNVNPGAKLAAQGGAVSTDGSRVYFTEAGKLWLREGSGAPHELAAGGEFQTATPSGAFAFYTKEVSAGDVHLYRYSAGGGATDLTPSGGVIGVLGASEDASRVYYQDATGLEEWHAGATTTVASGAAQASDWPPTTATARVSADGTKLLFLSKARLTGYDNTDQATGQPDSEVFLWSAAAGLACLSCNPTNERPTGPSTIPGAYANGTEGALGPGQIVTDSYKPRALSQNGRRAFFDSSDALVLSDTDNAPDVYQWEAQGEGTCARPGGCLGLISSGRSAGGGAFVDASASGSDAFFLTDGSLVPADPGSADLYDAREGGGFPLPPSEIPCQGDACQTLPPEPEDPEPGTLRSGPGNPPLVLPNAAKCRKGQVLRKGRCVKKPHHRKRRHRKRGHR